ncbi:DUF4386 domain-containing protein [Nostoc sp. CMAA1605]|uniref:DUF4386 domain-containing protein n=1 Tax=Nostoc sp. CMAA1605 TaxID=2055159 RepID=UPI001F392884|nr:DUF4386 domain-containing protein [Nostoc sp. CMAA1605]MCF4968446.1 DUF4386 domain-containing protein [Nostoc sp. CMAA1605]
MNRANLVKTTGIFFIFLVVLLNIPYILLIQNFEYDDILREPVDYVLQKFQAGGAGLILTWFIFGLAALLFIPASTLLHQIIAQEDTPYLKTATFMGALSGILQSIGLMRWVFVVPILANLYNNPTDGKTTRETISVIYQVVHQYGGVVIGEYLGQTLLIFWTLGVGMAMLHSPLFKSWVAYFELMIVPLLVLGQSELLATVIPSMPVWEFTPVGFILWEIWILMIGISLLRTPKHRIAFRN